MRFLRRMRRKCRGLIRRTVIRPKKTRQPIPKSKTAPRRPDGVLCFLRVGGGWRICNGWGKLADVWCRCRLTGGCCKSMQPGGYPAWGCASSGVPRWISNVRPHPAEAIFAENHFRHLPLCRGRWFIAFPGKAMNRMRWKSGDSPRKRRIGRIRSKLRCAPEVQARQPSPHPPPFISHFFQHKNTPHLFASACCRACTNKWGAVPSGILFLVGVYPVCEGNQARTTRTPDGVSSSRMPRLLSSSRIRSASA